MKTSDYQWGKDLHHDQFSENASDWGKFDKKTEQENLLRKKISDDEIE